MTRRTIYDLRKARDRAHLLEGLAVALANIDPMIELIKASQNPSEAKIKLLSQPWPAGDTLALLQQVNFDASRPSGLIPSMAFLLMATNYRLSRCRLF